MQQQPAECATAADCCNGISCEVTVYSGAQYGNCCNAVGGSCQGNFDCCDNNCVNGTCACLPVDSEGCIDGECCSGQCVQDANGGTGSACLGGPGDPCNGPWACSSSNCVNGFCGGCSASTGGVCSTTADCCGGALCAVSISVTGEFPPFGPAEDGGLACCGEPGASCDGGENKSACCSGACSNGVCVCANPTDQCFNSESCCAGAACMTRASSGSGFLACCQIEGQFCLANDECCSGLCDPSETCACVPDGGGCGAAGTYSAEGAKACCSGVCGDAGACL
jgi:hypothetical protein